MRAALAQNRLHGGQEQRHQDADDRDHDQQLDQREASMSTAASIRQIPFANFSIHASPHSVRTIVANVPNAALFCQNTFFP